MNLTQNITAGIVLSLATISCERHKPNDLQNLNPQSTDAAKANYKQDWINAGKIIDKSVANWLIKEMISQPIPKYNQLKLDFSSPCCLDNLKDAALQMRSLDRDLEKVGPIVAKFFNTHRDQFHLSGEAINDAHQITYSLFRDSESQIALLEIYRGQSLECFAVNSVLCAALTMLNKQYQSGMELTLIGGIFFGELANESYLNGVPHCWLRVKTAKEESFDICSSISMSPERPSYLVAEGDKMNILPIVGIGYQINKPKAFRIYLTPMQ